MSEYFVANIRKILPVLSLKFTQSKALLNLRLSRLLRRRNPLLTQRDHLALWPKNRQQDLPQSYPFWNRNDSCKLWYPGWPWLLLPWIPGIVSLARCILGILLRHWSHCNQLQWWANSVVFHVDVSLSTVFRASFNTFCLFFRFFLDNSYTSRTWCSRSGSCGFVFVIFCSVYKLSNRNIFARVYVICWQCIECYVLTQTLRTPYFLV